MHSNLNSLHYLPEFWLYGQYHTKVTTAHITTTIIIALIQTRPQGTHKMLQRLPDDFYVTLLEKRITPTISARDLGIQLDSTLSFNEHIANTVSTCIASLCQINRVKHLFDPKILENIISSLVFSKLYYCSNVWSSTTKKNIEKLQKVQNFAARIITGTQKYEHITPCSNTQTTELATCPRHVKILCWRSNVQIFEWTSP